MPTESAKSLKLSYCYAREDKALRDELDRHLSGLKREYQITSWSDGKIIPGAEWQKEIDAQLNTANIILLLISAHFMASDYCYGIEMKRALERHEAGTACVIPIILRPVYWENAPFSKLQVLPTDAKPVSRWRDRDEAFWYIDMVIGNAIKDLIISLKTKEEWLEEGNAFHALKRYDEALDAYEQALHLDPSDAIGWNNKGLALGELKRYEEAFTGFEQILHLGPGDAIAWQVKGFTLENLKHYEEALTAFEQILHLGPGDAIAWQVKGFTLENLKHYEEALTAYEQAIRLDPSYALAWRGKGAALHYLKHYEEALTAYEQAIRLDPSDAIAWNHKGLALGKLKRYEEALAAY